MKYFNILIFASLIPVFFTCNGSKSTTVTPSSEYAKKVKSNTEWNLKNRITNCDSAFVFMDHIIVPVQTGDAKLDNLYPKERETKIVIPGETQDFFENEKYHFYINPECLIGRKSKEVLNMICTNQRLESYLKMDMLFQEEKSSWYMIVTAMNSFHMTIHFENGNVARASVYGGISKK